MSELKVIAKRDIIRSVPHSFERQYGHARDGVSWHKGKTRGDMIDALKALDVETCTADDVNAIIGNTLWTDNKCDVCESNEEMLVRIGDDPDHDARWVDICSRCACAAWTTLSGLADGLTTSAVGMEAPPALE